MSVRKERQAISIEPPVEDLDPAVENALGTPAKRGSIYGRIARVKEMTPAQRRKAEKDRARTKETYDLPAWLIEAIEQIARKYGVPKSNVAAHLLTAGLRDVLEGKINLGWVRKISRSPRYEGLLENPEEIDKSEISRFCHGK